jgi:hypothetical protein
MHSLDRVNVNVYKVFGIVFESFLFKKISSNETIVNISSSPISFPFSLKVASRGFKKKKKKHLLKAHARPTV